MLVIEFNLQTQGTPNKNTATVLTANGPEKENGSEKKEPLILIIDKTRSMPTTGGESYIPSTGENTGKGGKKARHHHLIRPQ